MKRFTAIFFMGLLAVFTCLVFAGISMKAAEKLTTTSNAVNIDWEKLYPFEENSKHLIEPKLSLFAYVKEKIENYTSEKIAGKFKILEAAKTYEELIGWNMAAVNGYNPVIKLHDGCFATLVASTDVSGHAEAVKNLNEFCRDLGIEYVYVNVPTKICVSEDEDISGILDYSNQNTDRFLDSIGRAEVKYYDLRKILHADGMNHHEAFFITDHHWKPETGLWAAKHILKFLRDDYGWDVDPEILNPDKFEHVIYPDWYLGSQGKKLTLARTNPEDFTMLYPKFRTLIHFEAPAVQLNISGDFSVSYNMKHIERRDYYYLTPYVAYKYGGQPLDRIHNLLNHNGKKILIIHDSMFDCVTPFLALGTEEINNFDPRYFTGSLRSYIKASRPDMVITAYNTSIPGTIKKPNNKLYNLR